MKNSSNNTVWSVIGIAVLATTFWQPVAYADRDERRDRGPRHEQRWHNGHDRGNHWERQRQVDRRWDSWDKRQRPVVVQHRHYHFRDDDRSRLRDNYRRQLQAIHHHDRHRPYFIPGQVMLPAYRPHITPVPVHVLRTLPPPPPGYVIGYYQGYNVVYDPATYAVLTVMDLLTR